MDMTAGGGREGLFAWALPMAAIGDRQQQTAAGQQTAADDARPGLQPSQGSVTCTHCNLQPATLPAPTALFQRPQT
jgi:hypothetical protein